MLKDLTYRVVVIDDEAEHYEDYTEFIEEHLEEEGYLLDHNRYEVLEDLDDNQIEDVDLFLVDLKFGNEDKGPEFIRKIREKYLTDILFYSSDTTKIHQSRVSGEFQGVFFAVRDENKNEINALLEQLITKMIKRANTPLASRGIVMAGVSEIDNIVKDKVSKLEQQIPAEKVKSSYAACCKLFFESIKGRDKRNHDFWGIDFHTGLKQWEDIKEALPSYSLDSLVRNVAITDSSKNFSTLLSLYRAINGRDDTYHAISGFDSLLGDRNILAHVQETKNDTGYFQFKKLNGDDFLILNEETCKALRKAIIQYCKGINSI